MTARTDPKRLRDDELLIERTFDAPLALVFRVWSDRDHMLGWLGPKDFTCTHLDYDFRVGGKWRACIVSQAYGENWMGGEFKEIEQNRRIVYTFKWDDDDDAKDYALDTLITVTFAEKEGKTVQSFHQTPFSSVESRDSHVEGWNESFDREQEYIARIARETAS
ncbi:MAG: SRPBCC domain-containing protein [Rhizobiaceae bacterium]